MDLMKDRDIAGILPSLSPQAIGIGLQSTPDALVLCSLGVTLINCIRARAKEGLPKPPVHLSVYDKGLLNVILSGTTVTFI